MPFARATGIGSTFACADHSKSVCFFDSATISSPLIVVFNVSVAISAPSHHEDHEDRDDPEKDNVRDLRELRDLRGYLFSIASRFALNSFPAFHSGHLSA